MTLQSLEFFLEKRFFFFQNIDLFTFYFTQNLPLLLKAVYPSCQNNFAQQILQLQNSFMLEILYFSFLKDPKVLLMLYYTLNY